jgi:hypothetical protein
LQVVLFAADFYAALGKMDTAKQVMGKLTELTLDPGIRELAEGDFRNRYVDPQSAMEAYRAGIKLAPHNALGTLDRALAARIWPEVVSFLQETLR